MHFNMASVTKDLVKQVALLESPRISLTTWRMAYSQMSVYFDKVGHKRLIEKLKWYGILGETNPWIESFHHGRTQSVVLDDVSSNTAPVISGVPQGSVLGPCLFLFYINDIAQNLNSTTRLFADDTMIYMTIKSDRDAKLLQDDLDTLSRWENKWMMEFHPGKYEVISITRKKIPIQ